MASDALPAGGPWEARLEEICSSCHGAGEHTSMLWQEWDAHLDRLNRMAEGAEEEPLLRQTVAQLVGAHEQDSPSEARHTPCPQCEGKGTIPTEEGRRLLAFLRRHL